MTIIEKLWKDYKHLHATDIMLLRLAQTLSSQKQWKLLYQFIRVERPLLRDFFTCSFIRGERYEWCDLNRGARFYNRRERLREEFILLNSCYEGDYPLERL